MKYSATASAVPQIVRKVVARHGICVLQQTTSSGFHTPSTYVHQTQVEKGAQVAAGAVVAAGTTVPAGELWGGNPARCLRPLKPEEASFIPKSAQMYAQLGGEHAAEASKAA